jgi:hypothetical protein
MISSQLHELHDSSFPSQLLTPCSETIPFDNDRWLLPSPLWLAAWVACLSAIMGRLEAAQLGFSAREGAQGTDSIERYVPASVPVRSALTWWWQLYVIWANFSFSNRWSWAFGASRFYTRGWPSFSLLASWPKLIWLSSPSEICEAWSWRASEHALYLTYSEYSFLLPEAFSSAVVNWACTFQFFPIAGNVHVRSLAALVASFD